MLSPYDQAQAGMTLEQDPTGLTVYPNTAPWLERMMWTSEDLTADVEAALDSDADFYDTMNVPDDYMTFLAGEGNFDAELADALGDVPGGLAGESPFGEGEIDAMWDEDQGFGGPGTGNQGFRADKHLQFRTQVKWQKTAVGGLTANVTSVAMGAMVTLSATATITPQHDFVDQDLTVVPTTAIGAASPNGLTLNWANVLAVSFADRDVWNEPTGVPIGAFAPGSFLRGVAKGSRIRGGLSIRIAMQWNVTEAGVGPVLNDVQMRPVLTGLKPQTTC